MSSTVSIQIDIVETRSGERHVIFRDDRYGKISYKVVDEPVENAPSWHRIYQKEPKGEWESTDFTLDQGLGLGSFDDDYDQRTMRMIYEALQIHL